MAGEKDELGLDMADLMDIFGVAEEKADDKPAGLEDVLEDIFFGDGDPAPAAAPERPAPAPARPAPTPEPEPAAQESAPAADAAGAAAIEDYEAFKREVIARHERKKAEEEAAAKQALEAARAEAHAKEEANAAELAAKKAQEDYDARRREIIARYEAQKKAIEEAEKAPTAAPGAPAAEAHPGGDEAEARRAALLEKYKQAKAAAAAKAAAPPPAAPAPAAPGNAAPSSLDEVEDAEKEAKFREFLRGVRERQASAPAAKPTLPKLKPAAREADEANPYRGMTLDLSACLALAALYNDTNAALFKRVADKISSKAAKTMMMKTLQKACATYGRVLNRAARDNKGALRPDGSLDTDLLARSLYALPEEQRVGETGRALHDLLEIRFMAIEMGMGTGPKGAIVSGTLNAMDMNANKQKLSEQVQRWYFDEVIPASVLMDGE